eukprot:scaffold30352_cov55-Phaeocystis_antarctica.AAC.2
MSFCALRKAAPLGALRVPQSIWSEPNGQRPDVAPPVLGSGPPSSHTPSSLNMQSSSPANEM